MRRMTRCALLCLLFATLALASVSRPVLAHPPLWTASRQAPTRSVLDSGARILLDETFANGHTTLTTKPGVLVVDGDGYEMSAAAGSAVVGRSSVLQPLAAYAVLADLSSVSGPLNAGYGIDLRAGEAEYAFEVRPSGQYSVQQLSGGRRRALVDWTDADVISAGQAANELRVEYAGGMLQLFINGVEVGWAALPGTPTAITPGLIAEGGATVGTQVRCAHFQVRDGPIVALNDHFTDLSGAWPLEAGVEDIEGGSYHVRQAAAVHTLTLYPGAAAPSGGFAADVVIDKVSGPDNMSFGLRFLTTGPGAENYVFLITGAGRYALLHQLNGRYIRLIDFTPLATLHQGNAVNELYVRFADGVLALGVNGRIVRTLTLTDPPTVGLVGLEVNGLVHLSYSHVLLTQPVDPAGRDALQPAPALPARTTVLTDTFTDNHNTWHTDAIDTIAGGAYRIRNVQNTSADAAYRGWAPRLRLDPAYSFAATVHLNPGSKLNAGYGLVFLDQSTGGQWDLFSFEITGNGLYSAYRDHAGVWNAGIPWTSTPLLGQGYVANRLRVDVLGGSIALYINGQHVADRALPSLPGGSSTIGFVAGNNNLDISVSEAKVTMLMGSTPAAAPRPTPPASSTPIARPVQAALSRALPSVVHITVSSPSAAQSESSGTGFVIRSDSTGVYIATAGHVVRNVNPDTVKSRVTITMQTGKTLKAVDLAFRPQFGDVAVIKVAPQAGLGSVVAQFGPSSQVQIGDPAWAIGYIGSGDASSIQGAGAGSGGAFGGATTNTAITQPGLVSNTHVVDGGVHFLTTSATLAEGMSGGPLVYVGSGDQPNLIGKVIGLDDAYAKAVVGGGGQTPNLNEVLPSDDVVPIIAKLYGVLHVHP